MVFGFGYKTLCFKVHNLNNTSVDIVFVNEVIAFNFHQELGQFGGFNCV